MIAVCSRMKAQAPGAWSLPHAHLYTRMHSGDLNGNCGYDNSRRLDLAIGTFDAQWH